MAELRDAIIGLAVGDALGVPYEFSARDTFECTGMTGFGTYSKPAGTWSDDTTMTIATCDSIRKLGRIDTADMRERFAAWVDSGAYTVDGLFDIGNTTLMAIRQGCGAKGEHSNGNGSLMRIIPLAFANASDNEIAAVSAITHAHELSISLCQRYVAIARRLITGERPQDIEEIASRKGKPRCGIESSGYVAHTFDAALWCIANTSCYRDCVLAAVNLGDDTDTTAAVAGALAGIIYGEQGIPREWLDVLRGRDIIEATLFA